MTMDFESSPSFITYKSPEHEISIDYPADWIKVDKETVKEHPYLVLSDPLVVAFMAPREKQSDYINTEAVSLSILTDIPKEINLDEYVRFEIRDSREKNPNLKILQSTLTWLSGPDIAAHKFAYSNQGLTHLYLETMKPTIDGSNNTVYVISYVAQNNRYPIYLPLVEKMIDSFRILE